MAGALMWPSVSHAQGFCYLINSEGEVVNLDDLCQDRNAPETSPTPEAGDASTETQGTSSSSEVRNTTIISPAGTSPAVTSGSPDSSTDPNQANPNADNSEASPTGAESPENPASETTPAETTPDDSDDAVDTGPENRLDIPVREIETPEIPQIQTPQRLDSTGDDTDTSQ